MCRCEISLPPIYSGQGSSIPAPVSRKSWPREPTWVKFPLTTLMKQKLVFTSGILPRGKCYFSFCNNYLSSRWNSLSIFFTKSIWHTYPTQSFVFSFFTDCLVLSAMCHSPFFFDNLLVDDRLVHIATHFTASLMSDETNRLWIEHAVVG